MFQPSLEQLLEAGVHFGHQTRRWNPKMRRFIFAERNGIHIIDLQKTLRQLELAQKLAREVVLRGDNVLFVCTKRQVSSIVQTEAERCGAMYVTERWLGGLLTNFQTVKKQTRRLKELESGAEEGGDFKNYTKKEQLMMTREKDKLHKNLSGIKNMARVPGLMFIVDSKKERIAVSEANKLGIQTIALVDTNADPDLITVPVAGNDDAIRSVELMTKAIADAIIEARREAPSRGGSDDESEGGSGDTTTYSSERGMERGAPRGGAPRDAGAAPAAAAGGEDRTKRPRRRRAKPEAIAARLKGAEGEAGAPDTGSDTGSDVATDDEGGDDTAE